MKLDISHRPCKSWMSSQWSFGKTVSKWGTAALWNQVNMQSNSTSRCLLRGLTQNPGARSGVQSGNLSFLKLKLRTHRLMTQKGSIDTSTRHYNWQWAKNPLLSTEEGLGRERMSAIIKNVRLQQMATSNILRSSKNDAIKKSPRKETWSVGKLRQHLYSKRVPPKSTSPETTWLASTIQTGSAFGSTRRQLGTQETARPSRDCETSWHSPRIECSVMSEPRLMTSKSQRSGHALCSLLRHSQRLWEMHH